MSTQLSRRKFLKFLGLGAASAAAPKIFDSFTRAAAAQSGIPDVVYSVDKPTVFLSQKRLEIWVNNGAGGITRYPFMGPTQNRTYRIQPGRYQFDWRTMPIPKTVATGDGGKDCEVNSEGFCKIYKYSLLEGTQKKVPEQFVDLVPWGNRTHATWCTMFFKPEGDNRPLRKGDFVNAFHSNVSLCSKSRQAEYLQNSNPVDYFGDNPLQGQSPGCSRPPETVAQVYKSHGCIRMGWWDVWALYTFLMRNHLGGVNPKLVVLD